MFFLVMRDNKYSRGVAALMMDNVIGSTTNLKKQLTLFGIISASFYCFHVKVSVSLVF